MVGGARVLESRASHLSSMESDEIAGPEGDDLGDDEALVLAVANRRFPAAPKFIDLVPLSPQSSSTSGSSAPSSQPTRPFPTLHRLGMTGELGSTQLPHRPPPGGSSAS